MLARMRCSLPILCIVLLAIFPAAAAEPSFADLLARAQAQAAAGHRWDPPGDNFVETVVTLFSRLPTATPEEIKAFKTMVESDQKAMQKQTQSMPALTAPDAQADAPPAVAAVAPATQADAPPPVAAIAPDAQADAPPPVAAIAPDAQADAPPPVAAIAPDARVNAPPPPQMAAIAPDARVNAPPPLAAVAPDAQVPLSAPAPAAVPTREPAPPPPVGSVNPDGRAVDLYKRGQDAEKRGDISGARRFYAAAVQYGSATAARSLGRLYDPEYVRRNTVGGIDADAAIARHWYERATALGDPEAGHLLQALSSR